MELAPRPHPVASPVNLQRRGQLQPANLVRMLSRRIPPLDNVNAWSRALAAARAAGVPLLDLTESNPTHVGLGGLDAAGRAALAEGAAAAYEPDPRGLAVAREAIAGYYAGRGIIVDPGDLVLTSGTSEGYAHVFRLLADPGEAILAPLPSYPLFEPLAAAEGVDLRPYRLRWDGAWHIDLASVETALHGGRARALVIVQPHHPTGLSADGETLAALEALCAAHDVALVSDEVFGDFPWPPDTRPCASVLEGERRVPAFALSGLSKVCGMPQLKLGWIALGGPRAERERARAGLEWLADLFLSVASPVQLALPRLLEVGPAYRQRVRARIGANLAALAAFLAARTDVDLRSARAGWVAPLRLPARRGDLDWALAFLERGVALHPGHFYDLEDEAHVVASLIVEPATLAAALERIGEGLDAP